MALRAKKASQTLLDSYFTADNITQSVLYGHSDGSIQAFLQPVSPTEPLNANARRIPYL